jgi:hypothetical protein
MSEADNETPSSTPATPPGKSAPSFKAQFQAFSKFGDTKSDGRHITLSQSDKWMKQARVVDGKKITTTDTGIYFKKLKYVTPVYSGRRLPTLLKNLSVFSESKRK